MTTVGQFHITSSFWHRDRGRVAVGQLLEGTARVDDFITIDTDGQRRTLQIDGVETGNFITSGANVVGLLFAPDNEAEQLFLESLQLPHQVVAIERSEKPPIPPSENFLLFERDFLHANTWPQRKDGPPYYLLDRLTSEEQRQAETLLIEALGVGDDWPVMGLGHLRSIRALAPLYRLLETARLSLRISVAYAIYQINADPNVIEVVLEEFPKITNEYTLIYALHLLPMFPDPRIRKLLEGYTNDGRYLVEYNACVALGRPTGEVVKRARDKKRSWWHKLWNS